MRRGSGLARFVSLVAILSGVGASAAAEIAKAPDSFAVPIARGKPALGAGYDSTLGAARAEPGACVEDIGTERSEEPSTRYSIATLSRAGGRLVIGVHVAVVTAVETLASPRLTDASRRLGQADGAAFRDLCGDGYVARVELGGHWLAELEIDRADVARAGAGLVTGTWSDAEPFRTALESLTKLRTSARELPGGSRADAVEIAPAALVERAVTFPSTVTSETERPFLAVFAGYTRESLSGVVLPGANELDGRDVAEQVFRGGRSAPGSTAASRAAEMRLAQVHRYEPEAPAATAPSETAPITLSNESLQAAADPTPPPAAPAPPAAQAPPAAPAARATAAAAPQVHKQAAFVFEEAGAPTVYATTVAPGGVHAERQRQRFYWVPGAARTSPAIDRAIAAAMAGTPVRGVTVAIVEVGADVVVMTDVPPLAGVFSTAAGERRAWIAGVAEPDASQRAALDAAVRAERAAE